MNQGVKSNMNHKSMNNSYKKEFFTEQIEESLRALIACFEEVRVNEQ